jgi:crotonobetainyl-CoA:carnitine CoA-transferase CaiB-like acyl-CoA transferase
VYGLDQVFADPQLAAREMHVELPHPVIGTFRTTGLPIKWSRTRTAIERRPPLFAEHTREVLGELGLGAAEIETLERDGIARQS